MNAKLLYSRRDFIATAALSALSVSQALGADAPEPIIDIHQHLGYGGKRDKQGNQIGPGRTDAHLLMHQHNMGVTQTIMLPAGRAVIRPSTHEGFSNGLQATCKGNAECMAFAHAHPKEYLFGSNEVPDLEDAVATIEKYLKLGACCIGEQKFGVECDSPQMQAIYQLAADYQVPILMHWQYGTYNYGYERFGKMVAKFPKTTFVAHAQTFWANIDKDNKDNFKNLYPRGKVVPGGLSDRYLSDYPNFYGDLSAGSGYQALNRDPDHARGFLDRHQDKLVFGSDCDDSVGHGPACTGWMQIQQVRRLAPNAAAVRKMFYENAKRLYRIS